MAYRLAERPSRFPKPAVGIPLIDQLKATNDLPGQPELLFLKPLLLPFRSVIRICIVLTEHSMAEDKRACPICRYVETAHTWIALRIEMTETPLPILGYGMTVMSSCWQTASIVEAESFASSGKPCPGNTSLPI